MEADQKSENKVDSLISTHKMEATHRKTEGGALANSERKAVHMNIIMCRASYSGWTEAWPHNFIHEHSFLVLVLQGLHKQLYAYYFVR